MMHSWVNLFHSWSPNDSMYGKCYMLKVGQSFEASMKPMLLQGHAMLMSLLPIESCAYRSSLILTI